MAKIEVTVVDKASKPLKAIDKEAEKLDGSLGDVSEEAKDTSINFQKLAVAAAAVAASMAVAVKAAIDSDRAMFGLDTETRKYIRSASEAYGINETVIAQYTRLGVSAGLAGGEIATMIDKAVALGRLYPTESTEEMIDNLREFYRTGQDAGYVTDVLESAFKTTKLETIAFTDKIAKLEEITGQVNEQFAKTKAGRYDIVMTMLANATTDFGNAILDLLEGSGALWVFQKALDGLSLSANGYAQAFALARANMGLFGTDVAQAEADLARLAEESIKIRERLGGAKGDGSINLGTMTVTGESSFDEGMTGVASKTASAIKKTYDDVANVVNAFWDDYNSTMMTSTEYQLTQLSEQYTAYDKYVKDKVALEEWFNTEVARIMDEQSSDYKDFWGGAIDEIGYGMTDMFRSWQDGALNWKDTMKNVLNEILAQMFEMLVVKQLIESVSSSFGGVSGILGAFADGGRVPTTGNYLVGERGAEIVTLPSGSNVTPNDKIGVAAPTVVNVNNYGNDQVSVNQEGNQIDIVIAQIANGITRGTGAVGDAIQSRYGLRKQ